MTLAGYTVHPVAALFAMLPLDELRLLANDIKRRGLLHPIVLDTESRILDGRNRLAACDIAGVEPRFDTYDGPDPDGYALTVNIARRQMTKGQIAIVAARALLETSNQSAVARIVGVSQQRIGQAAVILDHAVDLADDILVGRRAFDDAYAEARKRKTDRESDAARLAALRESAPDLAELVDDERMAVGEAHVAWQERERRTAEQRRDSTALLDRVLTLAVPSPQNDLRDFAQEWAEHVDNVDHQTLTRLDRAIDTLTALRKALA